MRISSAEISDETVRGLDLLGLEYETSRDCLIAEAIERFLREEMEFVLAIHEGEADAEAGRVHTREEVLAMFTARREARDAA